MNTLPLNTLEIELDGSKLELAKRTLAEQIFCRIVCGSTRIGGVALMGLGLWLALTRGDYIGAVNVVTFGFLLFLSGIIGLREFQNAPRHIILDADALHFADTWTGERRDFPRESCLEAYYSPDNAAIYIMHPDRQLDLLAMDIPQDAAPVIVNAINRHLTA